MARMCGVIAILWIILVKVVSSFLTIGWDDTGSEDAGVWHCRPDEDKSVTTDYVWLYSIQAAQESITSPCYCSLSPEDHNVTALDRATMTLSIYNKEETRFETLLKLKGASSWGINEYRDSFYFETTAGDNPELHIPVIETSFPLNSTIYITIIEATVNMNCSAEAYIIPVIPTEGEGVYVVPNATTMHDKSVVVKWYQNTRILIIIACVAVTLIITGIILGVLIARKRRTKATDTPFGAEDPEWRTPVVLPREGTSRPNLESFAEVDTFIDDDDDEANNVDENNKTSSKNTKEKSLLKKQSLTKEKLKEKDKYGVLKNKSDIDSVQNLEDKTQETTSLLLENDKTQVLNSNPTPDLLKKGIYDNLAKADASTDANDSYIHPEAKTTEPRNTKLGKNKTDTDSYKGIDEIPEYAEIEEMQMLLRNPPVNKNGTNTSNTTTTSNDSSKGNKDKKPSKKFKLFGKNKDKTKEDKDRSKGKECVKSKCKSKQQNDSKNNDIRLTDLDFSQLKDAIDKMDPQEVKQTMKQVSESPSLMKKNMQQQVEPIYTNTPPPKPPRLGQTDGTYTKQGPNTSPLGTRKDDAVKYDSPRNSQKELAPDAADVGNSAQRPKLTIPLDTARVSVPASDPTQPVSPRSKWGAPVDVSQLYTEPEKPSRLPRPTSPGPQSPGTAFQSPQNKIRDTKRGPSSSYHVPKSSSSSPSFVTASTPTSVTQTPAFAAPGRFQSKPDTSNSTSSAFPKSPSSPTSLGTLKSLGLVVKATEALQSPRTVTKQIPEIRPTSNAFSSAYNKFKDMTPEPPTSRQDKPLVSGIKSPNRSFSENRNKPLPLGLNQPGNRFKQSPSEPPSNYQNKRPTSGLNSPYNRFKPTASESIYDNKQSLSGQSTPSQRPKSTAVQPSSAYPGYRSQAWARPASQQLDSAKQDLQLHSQFRL